VGQFLSNSFILLASNVLAQLAATRQRSALSERSVKRFASRLLTASFL